MEALKNAGFRKVGLNQDENHFFAQTEISTPFFSEYIVVRYRTKHSSTILDFKSICVLPTQLLDWGKNKSNYRDFEEELKKLVQPAQLQKVG